MVAIFPDIIKIPTLQPYLLKKTLKAQNKLKELQLCINMQSIYLFLDIASLLISYGKCLF